MGDPSAACREPWGLLGTELQELGLLCLGTAGTGGTGVFPLMAQHCVLGMGPLQVPAGVTHIPCPSSGDHRVLPGHPERGRGAEPGAGPTAGAAPAPRRGARCAEGVRGTRGERPGATGHRHPLARGLVLLPGHRALRHRLGAGAAQCECWRAPGRVWAVASGGLALRVGESSGVCVCATSSSQPCRMPQAGGCCAGCRTCPREVVAVALHGRCPHSHRAHRSTTPASVQSRKCCGPSARARQSRACSELPAAPQVSPECVPAPWGPWQPLLAPAAQLPALPLPRLTASLHRHLPAPLLRDVLRAAAAAQPRTPCQRDQPQPPGPAAQAPGHRRHGPVRLPRPARYSAGSWGLAVAVAVPAARGVPEEGLGVPRVRGEDGQGCPRLAAE